MHGQLRHLVDSAQQGKTTIQVMPYRAGAHAGTTCPFVILDFAELTDLAVVYVETLAGESTSKSVRMWSRYTLAFDRLVAAALHPDESALLIEQAAHAMTSGPSAAVSTPGYSSNTWTKLSNIEGHTRLDRM